MPEDSLLAVTGFDPYVFETRNVAESDNTAHTRSGARAKGFRGSIVGGAVVYGQMIRPLVSCFGLPWLGQSWMEIRFKSPAYDGDRLETTIDVDDGEGRPEEMTSPGSGPSYRLRTRNAEGVELVEMRAGQLAALQSPDARAALDPVEWQGKRVEGTWERMVVDRPFRSYPWKLSLQQQIEYCAATGDDLALYLEGPKPPAHPGLVMAQGSRVVAHQFVMPFWIHASSRMLFRRVIRVDDPVEVRCVPIDKWRRGANDWVRFYQLYVVDGEPAIEVWKTSVIKVAPRTPRAGQPPVT